MSDRYVQHIVIEGVDCSGKTTLAKRVCEEYGYEYHHCGVPAGTGSLLEYYATLLLRERPTVFDRLHVGETCYGPVMRGVSRISPLEMVLMDRLVKATGTVVVISTPELEVVKKRWQEGKRSEYIDSDEKFDAIWQRFYEVTHCTYLDANEYPDDVGWLMQQVKEIDSCPVGVVGSPYASFMFVGERCNSKPGQYHLPFFSTSGSGGYLNACISAAGYEEYEIAFVNALDHNGNETDLSGKIKPGQQVIALGGTACKILESQVVAHHGLRHPQYWKRFKSSQTDEYIAQLRAIRNERHGSAKTTVISAL